MEFETSLASCSNLRAIVRILTPLSETAGSNFLFLGNITDILPN